jgi:pyruvate-ferredoxin/flavodoxin oxidoreductase
MSKNQITFDGNQAVASVAFRLNEVIAIYPITPSSPMGEWADQWYSNDKPNIWGTTPMVVEMQSEGGAAGAVHGALQTGSLSTTFTASQGLLLMIPNMYKIAGELTSTVFHVAARSLAAQALSIFGDHSDVMSTRMTGFALAASSNVQEAMDMALITQAATLESRVPFLHFFDGFRTSHEISKVEQLSDDVLVEMIDDDLVRAHRSRGLSPDNPVLRGTAQNPDVYFQGRETVNRFYDACPAIVEKAMDKFAGLTGREYKLFQYEGAPDAEHVIIMMGSGSDAAHEAVDYMVADGEKIGMIKVRLYRPFSIKHLLAALPASLKKIAVLDRTKEPGSAGEPLYKDVLAGLSEAISEGKLKEMPKVIGGRYGLSSKEFTPAMVKGIFEELKKDDPKNHFTIGINDDVTHTSLDYDPTFKTTDADVVRAIFYGLGADGTVGANKNSIKIIGEETDNHAQGFFVYDSKKSGAVTVSHLRFGPNKIRSTYLIQDAGFVACHQFNFLERINVLRYAAEGATFLLNSPYSAEEVWNKIPRKVQETIIEKKLKFYVVDGYTVAKKAGMGTRINTILQACFFAISGVLPKDEAIAKIKEAIKKTYGKRGDEVVQKNYAAVDMALEYMHEVSVQDTATSTIEMVPPMPADAPEFVRDVLGKIVAREGDSIPVSQMPIDGTFPTGTTQYEKRNVGLDIPVWEPDLCIECAKCVIACPHAVIRQKVYDPALLDDAPETFKHKDVRTFKEFKGQAYTIQIAPEDCTGCRLCVEVCPAKDKENPERKALNMAVQAPLRKQEVENWDYFLDIPDVDRSLLNVNKVKESQFLLPLFEFSGACAGCGETPYIKLLTQLFGDRMVIANATGCSSIYGGNLPTTPYTYNKDGRGPTWSNSLFEDNAEFGMGMRLTIDKQTEYARELVAKLKDEIGAELADEIQNADMSDEVGIEAQRARVDELRKVLEGKTDNKSKDLMGLADKLVKKSVWILGGDGWAYDIGYGGLDHVIASGRNVNILVMDTEVYSNTGGQASKATPLAATAKFAAMGKESPKKDLGLMAMSYGSVYVGKVAMGANDTHTLKTFIEAEAFDGPSIIIAYSHCIAHGYDMADGFKQQKLAVESGFWPLYRYDPRRAEENKNPLQLDSRKPKVEFSEFAYNENRYKALLKSHPERAEELMDKATKDVKKRWKYYQQLAAMSYEDEE